MKYKLITALLLGTLLYGCGANKQEQTASDSASATNAPKPIAFTPHLIDSSKLKTLVPGLRMYVVQEGSGVLPHAGETVIAHYHGTLLNGKMFDSSYLRGQPFSFTLGGNQVIQGWEKAFAAMKVGTKAVLILGPEMAYGDVGAGDVIPPKATLRFDVELLGVNGGATK